MAKTNLGKVCPLPRGGYSAEVEYSPLDIISYQGGSWMVTKEFQGSAPSTDNPNMIQLAAKGDTGVSAFDAAREGGYTGDYSQFCADLSAVDGLDMKADLDDTGFLKAEQLSPLAGRQCGITSVSYRTSNPALLIDGDKTIEFFFRLPESAEASTVNIYLENSGSPSSALYLAWYPSVNQLYCYCGGLNIISPVEKGGLYHVVAAVKEGNCSFYVNGKLIGTRTPEQVTSPAFMLLVGLIIKAYHFRMFDRGLSQDEAAILWNNGRPSEVILNEIGINGCVGEYLPQYLLRETWRDSSGERNDLFMSEGTAEMCYSLPQFSSLLSGYGAPAAPPQFIGQEYCDTENRSIYKAVGISNAADWLLIS